MAKPAFTDLSRRERQMMDIVYRREKATAIEIMEDMPDPPTNAAVRAKLQVLVRKGFLKYEREGVHYVYLPTVDKETAEKNALSRIISTFYDGSAGDALQGLFRFKHKDLSDEDLENLRRMIEDASKEGR